MSKPITKELKESLKIKNKTIVEMNLDVTRFLILSIGDKPGKQFDLRGVNKQVYPFWGKVLYGE